jgi:predicted amidophosphoribosyltransferase
VSGIDGEQRCGLCCRILPQFAKVVAHGSYQGGLRELIYLLKYGGIERSSIVLGRTAAEAIDIPLRGCWQAARN